MKVYEISSIHYSAIDQQGRKALSDGGKVGFVIEEGELLAPGDGCCQRRRLISQGSKGWITKRFS